MVAVGLPNTGKYGNNKRTVGDLLHKSILPSNVGQYAQVRTSGARV